MTDNILSELDFKSFMVDTIQANWNAVIKIYDDGVHNLPMVNYKHTCFSIGCQYN